MNEEHLEPSSASTDLTLCIYSLHCLHKHTYSQIVYTVAQKLLGNDISPNHVFQRSYSFELLVLDIIKKRNLQHPCDLGNINKNFMGVVLCVDRYMSYIIQICSGITCGECSMGSFIHRVLCRYMSYRCTHPHTMLCK